MYLSKSLGLSLYQISIEPYFWEEGPRLRMYLKLFPVAGVEHSNTFNTSEVLRINDIFTSWSFSGDDLFGPYELLNFSLLGPYSDGKHLNLLRVRNSAYPILTITIKIVYCYFYQGYNMLNKVRF